MQVGLTPSRVELPRNHCERMKAFKDADKPISLCPPEKDAKGRFFWRLGERPTDTEFAELNAPAVIPAAFPEWADVMNTWGTKLLDAVQDVAEMAALGFGLPRDAFRSRMQKAPHLLAPTASDFNKFGEWWSSLGWRRCMVLRASVRVVAGQRWWWFPHAGAAFARRVFVPAYGLMVTVLLMVAMSVQARRTPSSLGTTTTSTR